jgi:hypothetical protein
LIVFVPATPIQDAAGAGYLTMNYPDLNGIGLVANCAVRTNEGLMAAGFPSLESPFPGGLTRKAQSLFGAKTFNLPKGKSIPQELLDLLSRFEPMSNKSK